MDIEPKREFAGVETRGLKADADAFACACACACTLAYARAATPLLRGTEVEAGELGRVEAWLPRCEPVRATGEFGAAVAPAERKDRAP